MIAAFRARAIAFAGRGDSRIAPPVFHKERFNLRVELRGFTGVVKDWLAANPAARMNSQTAGER